MKYLITGANGFIGKNLVNDFIKNGEGTNELYTPSRERMNLLDFRTVKDVVHGVQPDVIIHLAGNSSGRPDMDNPSQVFEDNVCGTNNLLEACRGLNKKPRFIFASTIIIYGNLKHSSDFFLESSSKIPTSPYGVSKVACEYLIDLYTKQNIIEGVCIRLGATVGPNLRHGVVFDLINKVRNNPENLELLGECPGSIKPYTYISDVINGIKLIINEKEPAKAYNLCNSDNLSIKNLAEGVLFAMNEKRSLVWVNKNWAGDNPKLTVCNYKMKYLKWQPEYSSYGAIVQAVKDNL